jgi:hypothetical protein
VAEVASQIESLVSSLEAPSGVERRARGLHGFECGVTYRAGILLDWTPADGDGPNKGFASAQFKGDFFKSLSAEESAFAIQWLSECQPYRCTRIDLQMTNCETPLVPEIIKGFRKGTLRVRQKHFFEPKGLELTGGDYPKGATICHGTRTSDNYARQYDKHLQEANVLRNPDPGPPRRRDEVELKAPLAQSTWTDLVGAVRDAALAPAPDWEAEARFAQARIRHLLPIRDTSQWEGQEMPKNWASTAPEPAWWTELFSEEAVRIRREKGVPKAFLAKVTYPQTAYAGRFLQQLVLDMLEARRFFPDPLEASEAALLKTRDRFVRHAQESALQELLDNLPEADHEDARGWWFAAVRAAADGAENQRAEDAK